LGTSKARNEKVPTFDKIKLGTSWKTSKVHIEKVPKVVEMRERASGRRREKRGGDEVLVGTGRGSNPRH